MRRTIIIGVLVSLGLGAGISLWNSPVSFFDVLAQPLQALAGSSQQLQAGVLEVSENMTPVQEATRRLFKPWGVVHLIRRFPPVPPPDLPASDPSAPPQP